MRERYLEVSETNESAPFWCQEDVVTRLDKKLKDLELKRSKVVLEKVELPLALGGPAESGSGPESGKDLESPPASSGRHLSSNNKGRETSR